MWRRVGWRANWASSSIASTTSTRVIRHAIDRRCNAHVASVLGDLNVFYTESNLGRKEWYDAEQVLVGGIQPNMIVGMLLGADFVPAPLADADISPHCLPGRDLAHLPEAGSLLAHPLVRLWDDQLQHAADRSLGCRSSHSAVLLGCVRACGRPRRRHVGTEVLW